MNRCQAGANSAGWCAGDLVPSTSVPAVPDELGESGLSLGVEEITHSREFASGRWIITYAWMYNSSLVWSGMLLHAPVGRRNMDQERSERVFNRESLRKTG